MIENFLVETLSNVDENELKYCISNNISILQKYYLGNPENKKKVDSYLKFVLPLIKIDKKLTDANYILNKIKEGNINVYNIIITQPNGEMWLCSQISEIANELVKQKKKGLFF